MNRFSEPNWYKLTNFIIDRAADRQLTKMVSQYTEEYLDAGYPID